MSKKVVKRILKKTLDSIIKAEMRNRYTIIMFQPHRPEKLAINDKEKNKK